MRIKAKSGQSSFLSGCYRAVALIWVYIFLLLQGFVAGPGCIAAGTASQAGESGQLHCQEAGDLPGADGPQHQNG